MRLLSLMLTLLVVMDPVGNIPLFAAMLKDYDQRRQHRIVVREHLIALVILLLAMRFGPVVLRLLSVEEPAVRIGGGVVLFLIALRMVFPNGQSLAGDPEQAGEPLVVPLAVPLLAGPSALATAMLFGASGATPLGLTAVALIGAWTGSLLILSAAVSLSRWLRGRVLVAIERLMGMVLVVVAVQMLIDGVRLACRS